MRFMKWISMLTVFAMLFAMLPATVAADEINVDLGMSADDELELELSEADLITPPEVSIGKSALELDGLEGNLSYIENENHIGTPFVSNVNDDFEIDEEGTLTRYRGFEKDVVIPAEVKEIGRALGLPDEFVKKAPADGLSDKTDEDAFGFTYEQMDTLILTGFCDNDAIREKIERRHAANLFKLRPMPEFNPENGKE